MPIFNRRYVVSGADQNPAPQYLSQVGPRIPVQIQVPNSLATQLTAQGKTIPAPVQGFALVDTGASVLAVDDEVLRSLGLIPLNFEKVYTPGGERTQGVYPVALSFPGTEIGDLSLARCLGSDLAAQRNTTNTIALIGRDTLSTCVLIYNGKLGVFTLAY